MVVGTLTAQGDTPPLRGWLPASVLHFCVLCALLTSGSLSWISAGLPGGRPLPQASHSVEKS